LHEKVTRASTESPLLPYAKRNIDPYKVGTEPFPTLVANKEALCNPVQIVPKRMEFSDTVLMELAAGFFGSQQFVR